jgi:hypothetical protein
MSLKSRPLHTPLSGQFDQEPGRTYIYIYDYYETYGIQVFDSSYYVM